MLHVGGYNYRRGCTVEHLEERVVPCANDCVWKNQGGQLSLFLLVVQGVPLICLILSVQYCSSEMVPAWSPWLCHPRIRSLVWPRCWQMSTERHPTSRVASTGMCHEITNDGIDTGNGRSRRLSNFCAGCDMLGAECDVPVLKFSTSVHTPEISTMLFRLLR